MKIFVRDVILSIIILCITFTCNASKVESSHDSQGNMRHSASDDILNSISLISPKLKPIDDDLDDLIKKYFKQKNAFGMQAKYIGNRVYDFLDSINEGVSKYLAFWNVAAEISEHCLNPSDPSMELRNNLRRCLEIYFISKDGKLETKDEFSRVFVNRSTGDVGIWWTDQSCNNTVYLFRLINSGKMTKEEFKKYGMESYRKTMNEYIIDLVL